jgi:hypothetical protein
VSNLPVTARESPLPVRDECSDGLSEPRTEQGRRESRHFHSALPIFMLARVEHSDNSSAEINPRTPWGPLRRYGRTPPPTAQGVNREGRQQWCVKPSVLTEPVAPMGRAVNARVRERVTEEQIQPLRHLSLSSVSVSGGESVNTTLVARCPPCRLPPRPTRVALPTSRKPSLREAGGSASKDAEREPEYRNGRGILPRWCRTVRPQTCGRETAPFTGRRMS